MVQPRLLADRSRSNPLAIYSVSGNGEKPLWPSRRSLSLETPSIAVEKPFLKHAVRYSKLFFGHSIRLSTPAKVGLHNISCMRRSTCLITTISTLHEENRTCKSEPLQSELRSFVLDRTYWMTRRRIVTFILSVNITLVCGSQERPQSTSTEQLAHRAARSRLSHRRCRPR